MKLEYYGIDKNNLKSGILIENISPTTRLKHIKSIFSGKESQMLEWMNLPDMKEEELSKIESIGKVAKKSKNFVVLGIGGSALGVRLLNNTFIETLHKISGTKVDVCDNIDGDKFISFLDTLDLGKTTFNVITKSGTTSETLAQMMIVINRLRQKKLDISKQIIVTTTEGNNLWNWAVNESIPVLSIPKGVGGRFSVLSAVGLLPAFVMGVDVKKLLQGAKIARDNSCKDDLHNIAYTCAYINFTYLKKGFTNLVTMPYSDRLSLLPEFFAQLWAESLGKKFNKKGEIVYTGQTPIKTLGVTDQHSQLQLFSEGIKDKIIMFVRVCENTYDEKIVEELPFTKHLTGASLNTLMNYEYNATAYSLTTLDRPNYTLVLDRVDEENIGELIFMLEMMTAYMGEMLNIDAFDQPGVELSKIYTKAMLGVKGNEESAKKIKEYSKDKKNYVL